jgi:hypothetical protein
LYASPFPLISLGSVFVGFNEIAIKLVYEIENSLRITVVHSARCEVLD